MGAAPRIMRSLLLLAILCVASGSFLVQQAATSRPALQRLVRTSIPILEEAPEENEAPAFSFESGAPTTKDDFFAPSENLEISLQLKVLGGLSAALLLWLFGSLIFL